MTELLTYDDGPRQQRVRRWESQLSLHRKGRLRAGRRLATTFPILVAANGQDLGEVYLAFEAWVESKGLAFDFNLDFEAGALYAVVKA